MNECDRYEDTCKGNFERVFGKLDHIDEALRGNGEPGINVRLDRLEQRAKSEARLKLLAISATVSGVVSLVVGVIIIVIRAWQ